LRKFFLLYSMTLQRIPSKSYFIFNSYSEGGDETGALFIG
jgi:hypothetical protein